MLHQLIYTSQSMPLDPDAIHSILVSAHKNNDEFGITGVLVLINNTFIQVLEGSEEAITNLFEIIQADRRHQNVQQLSIQPIEERAFPNWTMGYLDKTPKIIQTMLHDHQAGEDLSAKLKTLAADHKWIGDFILDCQKELSQ
ncbi:BLUF domain-containing protein [Terasakiella pusilla]|uniref:BLUF domain-containing protein n=1 Tax=Terasakiella pusilla TaxID=64973 RepID=UPI003AA8476D